MSSKHFKRKEVRETQSCKFCARRYIHNNFPSTIINQLAEIFAVFLLFLSLSFLSCLIARTSKQVKLDTCARLCCILEYHDTACLLLLIKSNKFSKVVQIVVSCIYPNKASQSRISRKSPLLSNYPSRKSYSTREFWRGCREESRKMGRGSRGEKKWLTDSGHISWRFPGRCPVPGSCPRWINTYAS